MPHNRTQQPAAATGLLLALLPFLLHLLAPCHAQGSVAPVAAPAQPSLVDIQLESPPEDMTATVPPDDMVFMQPPNPPPTLDAQGRPLLSTPIMVLTHAHGHVMKLPVPVYLGEAVEDAVARVCRDANVPDLTTKGVFLCPCVCPCAHVCTHRVGAMRAPIPSLPHSLLVPSCPCAPV
jgi:hypothetical protein